MNTPTFIILIPGFAKDESDSTCLPAQQLLIKKINSINPQLEIIIITFQYPYTNKEYSWFGNRVIPMNSPDNGKILKLLSIIKI